MTRYAVLFLSMALADANAQLRTVSPAGDGSHVEPHLTGRLGHPNELVIASILVSDLDPTRWRVRVFWSNDGGERWQQARLPTKDGFGCSGDPWLAW